MIDVPAPCGAPFYEVLGRIVVGLGHAGIRDAGLRIDWWHSHRQHVWRLEWEGHPDPRTIAATLTADDDSNACPPLIGALSRQVTPIDGGVRVELLGVPVLLTSRPTARPRR